MHQSFFNEINKIDFNSDFIFDDIDGRTYSYNEFFRASLAIADVICEEISHSIIVAIMENSINLFMLYFAVAMTDKTIAVIDPQKGDAEIKRIVEGISDAYVILDESWDRDCIQIKDRNPFFDFDPKKYEEVIDVKGIFIDRIIKRNKEEVYLLTFTSGTTGETKGVEHTFCNLVLSALALNGKVNVYGGVFLHVMPMTYMAGILNSIIFPFIIGAKIVITKRFSVATAGGFWKKVTKYGANLFWLSPSMLMLIDRLDRDNIGENYCRNNKPVFLIGTAALTDELRKRFSYRYGVNLYASYGLSETLFVSVETPESLNNCNKNCVGEMLEGVSYKLGNGNELLISVPWMFSRYSNTETNKFFDEEYYKSGDLALVHNGLLYITGRLKELIVKGGMNISPVLMENTIMELSDVEEVVISGVSDGKGEERILCTYSKKNKNINDIIVEKNIRSIINRKLGKNYSIDYFEAVESIIRNINGKIDRNTIKDNWERKMNS